MSFTPLMTLYLTDNTPPEEVYRAKEAGIVAFKLYPAGATTNSGTEVALWLVSTTVRLGSFSWPSKSHATHHHDC